MDYQLFTNISLVIASIIALAVMLRHDMKMLQQHHYSTKKFVQWLHASDESYSPKRIVPMAALVMCASRWARQSWMVVALIAAAILAIAIVMLLKKETRRPALNARAMLSIVVALAVAAACAASLITAQLSLEAAMLLILLTSFSYVLALGSNFIVGLFYRKNNNKIHSTNQNEEI